MNRKLSIAALLATAGLLAATSSTFALEAILKQDANVRKNPTTNSAVVNHVEEDQEVEVLDCSGSWCKLSIPGPNGWVKKSFLAALDDEDDEIPFHMSVGPGGISFGIGDAPAVTVPLVPQVCFFKGNNFSGPSFCETPGVSNNQLVGSFNDQISSVQITGAASFKVCQDWFFGGACTTYNTSKAVLNGAYNDNVSAYEVY